MLEKLKRRAALLKSEIFALYLAYKDKRTPWYAKIIAGLVAAYAFSPIDLIPDFIPVLGYLDDLILVPLGISLSIKLIPPEVMAESRQRAQVELSAGKPINRTAAVVIILIWISLAYLSIRWLARLL